MDMTASQEKKKYRAIWQHNIYRIKSPAMDHVQTAAVEFVHGGSGRFGSLYDFGCGTGRATTAFRKMGFFSVGVDITRIALDSDYDGEFIESCLWEFDGKPMDYGFCVDVMEHIPEPYVDLALKKIHSAVKHTVYFCVDLNDESHGVRHVGESLHATIKPASWWIEKMQNVWPNAYFNTRNGQLIAIMSK